MIIEFNTGKTDIVLVKVAEDAKNFELSHWNYQKQDYTDAYTLIYDSNKFEGKKGDRPHAHLPSGDWQIVGNPFELSDFEWSKILPHFRSGRQIELLEELKVYRVNPFKHPIYLGTTGADSYNEMIHKYDQSEERTGPYILLTAVKA